MKDITSEIARLEAIEANGQVARGAGYIDESVLGDDDLARLAALTKAEAHDEVILTIEVDNVYDDGTVTNVQEVTVPAPWDYDEEALEDWAAEHLMEFTGTGRTEGDAGYFVIIKASTDPELLGNSYEWGI